MSQSNNNILAWVPNLDLAKNLRRVLMESYKVVIVKNLKEVQVLSKNLSPKLLIYEEMMIQKEGTKWVKEREGLIGFKDEFSTFLSSFGLEEEEFQKILSQYQERWNIKDQKFWRLRPIWKEFCFNYYLQRASENLSEALPALALVESDTEEDFERNNRAGAVEILKLPFTHQSLKQTVEALIINTESPLNIETSGDLNLSSQNPLDPRHFFEQLRSEAMDNLHIELASARVWLPDWTPSIEILEFFFEGGTLGKGFKDLISQDPAFFSAISSSLGKKAFSEDQVGMDEALKELGEDKVSRIILSAILEEPFITEYPEVEGVLAKKLFTTIATADLAYVLAKHSGFKGNLNRLFFCTLLMDLGEPVILRSLEGNPNLSMVLSDSNLTSFLVYPRHVEVGLATARSKGFREDLIHFIEKHQSLEYSQDSGIHFACFADFIVSSTGISHPAFTPDQKSLNHWLKETKIKESVIRKSIRECLENLKEFYSGYLKSIMEDSFDEYFEVFQTYVTLYAQFFAEISHNQSKKEPAPEESSNSDFGFDLADLKLEPGVIKALQKVLSRVFYLEDLVHLIRRNPVLAYYILSFSPNGWKELLAGKIDLMGVLKGIGKDSLLMFVDSFPEQSLLPVSEGPFKKKIDNYKKKSIIRSRASEILSQITLESRAEGAYFFTLLHNLGEYMIITDPKVVDQEGDIPVEELLMVWESPLSQRIVSNGLGESYAQICNHKSNPFHKDLEPLGPYPTLLYAGNFVTRKIFKEQITETEEKEVKSILSKAHWDLALIEELKQAILSRKN